MTMRLHLGQGTTIGALTAFPVWHDRTATGARRYTTDGAGLVVGEVDDGPQVGRLRVINHGVLPALVLDGQLFEGGWQHRMATRSTMVAAGAAQAVDVACVEQGRWSGGRGQVTRGRRASRSVRHGWDADGQHGVWERVARHQPASPTQSLLSRLDAPDDLASLAVRRVRPLAGQTGVLLALGGHPLSLEVFDHPDTLAEQLASMLRAACLDAPGCPAVATPGRRARRMVERLERLRLEHEPDLGQVAHLGRARSESVDVAALRHRHRTVHLRVSSRRHPVLVAG